MKRFAFVMLSSVAVLVAGAQSVADGVKAIYYEKYKTAKTILEKLVAANPADVDANYWLGQVNLNQGEIAAARSVYAKAMTTAAANPLIIVGMGHVELMEGKTADAKAHFDAALAATNNKKGGDPKILTAVGRANADGDSRTGDPVFGIEKLAAAAKLDLTNPDIYVLMGISQLKRGGEFGGESKKAYEEALVRDPKYAKAKLRIARIFLSQNNKELFLPLMEEATQLDSNYGPAWQALYEYYAERDVNKAKGYIDSWLPLRDKDNETDYFYADYLLRAGKYEESLSKAKELEASLGNEKMPKINKLYAINYDRLKDTINALKYTELFISTEKPEKITNQDYENLVKILGKFSGKDAESLAVLDKLLNRDTSTAEKSKHLRLMADIFKKSGSRVSEAEVLAKVYNLDPNAKNASYDLYYSGFAYYQSKNFPKSDSTFGVYVDKYPTDYLGWLWKARSQASIDTTMELGLALPSYKKLVEVSVSDPVKGKNRLLEAYGYMAQYYANIKKDRPAALEQLQNSFALDSTNASVKKSIEILSKPVKAAPPVKTPAKPSKTSDKPKVKGKLP